MRRMVVFALALLSSVPVLSAARPAAGEETALGASRWSLEVGTELGTSSNGTIGIRRHLSGSSALRLAAFVQLEHDKGTGEDIQGTSSPAAEFNDFTNTNMALHWMHFATVSDRITVTFAAGPVVVWNKNTSRDSRDIGLPSFDEFEFSNRTLTGGLDALLGFEWFFAHRLSLGGEAGLRGSLGKSKQSLINRSGSGASATVNERRIDSDIRRIQTNSGSIRLAMYF